MPGTVKPNAAARRWTLFADTFNAFSNSFGVSDNLLSVAALIFTFGYGFHPLSAVAMRCAALDLLIA